MNTSKQLKADDGAQRVRDTAAIRYCIKRCERSTTEGNRRRAERQCSSALSGDRIAIDCAAAARRIGAWLASLGEVKPTRWTA